MDKLDLLNIALRIESTGYEGYAQLSEKTTAKMKKFFTTLHIDNPHKVLQIEP